MGADISSSLESDEESDEEDEDDEVFAFLSVCFVFLTGDLALGAGFSSSLESEEDEVGVFAFFSLVLDFLADELELELESELLEAMIIINELNKNRFGTMYTYSSIQSQSQCCMKVR